MSTLCRIQIDTSAGVSEISDLIFVYYKAIPSVAHSRGTSFGTSSFYKFPRREKCQMTTTMRYIQIHIVYRFSVTAANARDAERAAVLPEHLRGVIIMCL